MSKVEYKKLIIKANALVKRGAVGEKAIFKSKDKQIIKSDDTKLEMHSIMYMVAKEDSHGAIINDQKVIEDACLDFMQNGDKRVKLTHDGDFIDAHVMQLYIVPKDHPIWKEEKYIGALATVTKFADEALYNQCKSEGWETSLEGDVVEQEINETDGIVKKVFEMVKKLLGKETPMEDEKKEPEKVVAKDYNGEKQMNELYKKYSAFTDAFWTIRNSDKDISEKIAEMKISVTQFVADLGGDADPVKTELDAADNVEEVVKSAIEKAIVKLSEKHEAAITEIKKEYTEKIREIRKDFALDKEIAPIVTAPVKKSLLS
jgi:hypothetical protein